MIIHYIGSVGIIALCCGLIIYGLLKEMEV